MFEKYANNYLVAGHFTKKEDSFLSYWEALQLQLMLKYT